MNKLFLITCFLFLSIANAQNNKISIESDVNYFHHLGAGINYYNHGFSLLIHNKINKFKISTGISYNTKNFNIDFTNSDYLDKTEQKVIYFNFPILLLSYQLHENQNYSIDVLNGFLLNSAVYNKKVIYYDNSPTKTYKLGGGNLGVTYRFGINLSKKLNDNFKLNVQPFMDYKLVLSYVDYSRESIEYSTSDNKVSLGLKIGLEYIF